MRVAGEAAVLFQPGADRIDQPAARIALKLGSEPVAVLPVLQPYGLIGSARKGHLRFGSRPLLILKPGVLRPMES